MRLNQDKTKVILFNNTVNYDFQPNLTMDDGNQLEVVEEMRLLGVQVRSDLSWKSNNVEKAEASRCHNGGIVRCE